MADYSIWVLEYCWVPQAPKGLLTHGAFNGGTVKLPWCYVLIKGRGRVALVDVGYNHKDYGAVMAESFGVENWHPSSTVLAECGVTPADVSHVLITHAHFDHMGATDDFPNATFYVQERELSKWVWAMSLGRRFRWLMGATDPGDILRAVDLARQVVSSASMATWRMCCRASISMRLLTPILGGRCSSMYASTANSPAKTRISLPAISSIPTPTWKVRTRKIRNTFRSAWPAEAKRICC
jgi:hypothetical protein